MSENQRDSESHIPSDAEIVQALPDESSGNPSVSDNETVLDICQNDEESSGSASFASNDQPMNNPAETNLTTSLGEQLRDERVRQGLKPGEVARRLCLSEQQVLAIESQDYASLPSPASTFLRGYVRNYARILRLANVDQLLQMLPRNLAAHTHGEGSLARGMQPVKLLSSHERDSGGGKWLYFLLAIGVALGGYMLFQSEKLDQQSSALLGDLDLPSLSESASTDGQTAIELPLPAITSPSFSFSAGAPSVPPPLPPVTQPGQVKEALSGTRLPAGQAIESTATAEEDGSGKSLHFIFSRDSWVKVKDSEGNVILEKIHARGSEQTISGKPPLYLVIGNAAGVTLTYGGRAVDLAPYTRGNDDVARFSLE